MQIKKQNLPGFKAESSILSSMIVGMEDTKDSVYMSDSIIPAVCVPCCNSDPYCQSCKRMCRGHSGEDYYFCLDRCVPGGITWP